MKKNSFKLWLKANLKFILCLTIASFVIFSFSALAAEQMTKAKTIADIANNIVQSFESIGQLLIATSYLVGIAMVISSLFSFKKHKESPNSVALGVPITTFFVGIMFIFLPGLIAPAGVTIFGGSAQNLQAGGFKGEGTTQLPGFSN